MFAQTTAIEDRPQNSPRGRAVAAQPVESNRARQGDRETAIGVRSLGLRGPDDPCRIPQKVIAALNEGRFKEALDQFGSRFKFTDHALGLEFEEKERLIEFFQKLRELFPDAVLAANAVSECKDKVVITWRLRATQTEQILGGLTRHVRISSRGVSIVKIENERISQWSDYYDEVTSHRTGLAALF
jgi:steroid delta-isomerase-like uncharacterized protein